MIKGLGSTILLFLSISYAFGAESIQLDKVDPEGRYIGKHIEYLCEKDLFEVISMGWKTDKIFKDKLLSGELHSDNRIELSIVDTAQGYRASMTLRNAQDKGIVEWGLRDILKDEIQAKFKPFQRNVPRLNFMPHSYWLRFRIYNPGHEQRELYLEMEKHFFSFIHLFIPGEEGITVKRSGFIQEMNQREVKYKNSAFRIWAKPGMNTYYLRIDSWFIDTIPLRLWSRDSFYYHMSVDSAILGIIAGILFLVLLYNLFIFVLTLDISYLYLSLMTICVLVIHISTTGIGFQYLWPNNPRIGLYVLYGFFPLLFIATLLFCRSFIETYQYTPVINRVMLIMINFFAILIPVIFIVPLKMQIILFGFFFFMDHIYYLPVVYSAIVVIRRGNRYGIFLLIGLALYLLSHVEWVLSNLNIIPYYLINYLNIKGASFILVMTLGLWYKFRVIRALIADYRKRLSKAENRLKDKAITDSTRLKIEKVKEFLRDNFHEDISREGLAAAVDISPDHLGRIFKQDTGEKISDFINTLRVEEASKKLRETDIKVIDIAFGVGFESLRTFNKVFRDRLGVSPSEYRKDMQK